MTNADRIKLYVETLDYVDQPVALRGQDVLGDVISSRNPLLHQKILHSVSFLFIKLDAIYIA